MIHIRRSVERGHLNFGWLDTYHTFSFGEYHDPAFMGFGHLRVINEDVVEPGMGFPTHSHRDMEIITYILEGEIEHKDSMGNTARIRPGEVQRMSAGTGVTHSEYNASKSKKLHLLQIWILPEKKGIEPGYEQKQFHAAHQKGRWHLAASPDGREGSVRIYQNASLKIAVLESGQKINHASAPTERLWLQVARGSISLNGETLSAGDGAAIQNPPELQISAKQPSEILLFSV